MSRAFLVAALLLGLVPRARAADDEERPPVYADASDRLMLRSTRELKAGVALLSLGGFASLGGLAAGVLAFMYAGAPPGVQPRGEFESAVTLAAVGQVAMLAGIVCLVESRHHKRLAQPFLWTF